MTLDDKLKMITGTDFKFNGLTIKQPTIGEIIEYGWNRFFKNISSVFVISWDYVGISEDDAITHNLKIFDLFWEENFVLEDGNGMDLLVKSLGYIFKTSDIDIDRKNKVMYVNSIILHRDNFDELCEIVRNILKVNKYKKTEVDNSEELKLKSMDEKTREIYLKYQNNRKKYHKSEDDGILKGINYIVHSQSVLDYKSVMNLTLFQFFNSQTTYAQIDSYKNNWSIALVGGSKGIDLTHWLDKFKMEQ